MESYRLLSAALLLAAVLALPSLSLAQNSPRDYLDSHNKARAEVDVGPVKWDGALEAYAKSYAGQRSADCELVHSQGPYGENIYIGFGEGYDSAMDAVRYWYDEKQLYDYESNSCLEGRDCLHYTQMVWRGSGKIGCARAACTNKDGWFFVTCNYDPPGNIWGERPY